MKFTRKYPICELGLSNPVIVINHIAAYLEEKKIRIRYKDPETLIYRINRLILMNVLTTVTINVKLEGEWMIVSGKYSLKDLLIMSACLFILFEVVLFIALEFPIYSFPISILITAMYFLLGFMQRHYIANRNFFYIQEAVINITRS